MNSRQGSAAFHSPPVLTGHEWKPAYETEDGDLVKLFYSPALACAKSYDRMTGYLSANALALAARGVDSMIANASHMRLRALHFRDRRCSSRLEIPRISTPQSGGRSTGGERCVKYARDSGNLAFRNQRVRLRQIRSSYRPGVGRARVSPNLRIRE